MEAFKLVNFKHEHNTNMPIVRSIEGSECEAVCRSLFRYWHVNTPEEFFEKEEQEFVLLDDINAEDEDFDWNKVFNSIGIPVPNEVFINFERFNNIDVFLFKDFCKYFDDIWYPAADDIEVFDSSFNWIVSVKHYGAVHYAKI
ncbi:hypothetical protein [Prevotella pallens]|uniref:Heat-shock protein n=2 Tax=Prevotella pallens TaxID=60133 RepID=A0ABX9DMP2_9BACT|nr:hypothetical protein [Prevotella pallens]EGQ22565.1 heat shock protein [Prevotella pallens ATCC 700821]RAS41397.1 hypothetical protein BC673_1377 [Prevotella pallens]